MRIYTIVLILLLVSSAAFAQVSVTSTSPAHNATSVPLTTTISITFSGAVDTTLSFAPGENFFTNVTTSLAQWWSADRRTISFSVILEPSKVYYLMIHSVFPAAGGGFPVPYCFYWTTGASFPANLHSVSGTITSSGSVTPDNAIVGLGVTPFTGKDPAFVGGAVTNSAGQFTIPYVADGTWYPLAAKDADLNGQIDPSMGDPIAYGDSVKVNGANVTGFTMPFFTPAPVRFAAARDTIMARATSSLPPTRQLRAFQVWDVDSTGAGRQYAAAYTVPGSSSVTEILVEIFGVRQDTSSNYQGIYASRPYTAFASAAPLDSVVARAERLGGREFRRQAPPVPGSLFRAYARLGALNTTEFGGMISDTSQYYWGLQYTFQIQVTRDSSYSVAWKVFLASATTGQILGVNGVEDEVGGSLPASFALAQNYPNPFNPSTTITFSLPTQSSVTIEVFNVLGQKVATLVNDVRTAGSHQAVWQAQVPSGLYFYRMVAAGTDAPSQRFTQVRKMMLIR